MKTKNELPYREEMTTEPYVNWDGSHWVMRYLKGWLPATRRFPEETGGSVHVHVNVIWAWNYGHRVWNWRAENWDWPIPRFERHSILENVIRLRPDYDEGL